MTVNINYVLFLKYYKVKKNYILVFCWCIEEFNRVHTLKGRSLGYVLENMTTVKVTSNLYDYNYDYYFWYSYKFGN